ncbi:tetratricopeptide repeat protein 36 homolog [Clytia hemisphaerica]|uniref:Tetratricopeptide repeat protein 36 n=1 Tax=Clytia hemisphaerica TaxID=252671 RepID=A0A7M5X7J3_9CNID
MADEAIGAKMQDELVLNAIFNPHNPLQIEESGSEDQGCDPSQDEVTDDIKKIEIAAVNNAQKGDFEESLSQFNEVLKLAPSYASGYNNRAQLFRLKGENESAMNDLNKAIELSQGKGYAASQAFVQRALISRLNKDNETALEDFQKAAKLGNAFAKQQITEMNPYAALCNQMLCEVFAKEFNPPVNKE